MVKQIFNLNVHKDSSDTDEAAQNSGNPKSLTFEIHHGGCFTPTPSRSLTKEWEQVSSKALSIGEVIKILSKKLLASSVEGPILAESGDPFEDLDEILDLKHDLSIGDVEVQEHDLDVINYDSFGSDSDDGIDSKRRIQLRELRRIGKQTNKDPNKYYFYLGHQFATKEIVTGRVRKLLVETKRNLILEVRTLIEDHSYIQSREIKACTSRFLSYHIIKTLATNPEIPVKVIQDQMQKQFDVGVSKMKAFRANRIATDKMTGNFRKQYSLLKEYAQKLINQNPGITVRIDVQQEPNPDSPTRTFIRVYVCLGSLKQSFRACGREILGLDGCFMSGLWPGQILTAVGVDANNGIYLVAYVIVEVESKASWCWFLNLLREDLGIEANFNYTFISNGKSAEHREMWPVIESTTVIVPPNHKPQVDRPPKKRKKSHDEIASQSCSSGKLSRKGTSVKCSKFGNLGHNRKGCRGQGSASQAGGYSQVGARKVAGTRNVSSQAVASRNASSQAASSSQPSAIPSTSTGARNASSQAVGASQPNASPSTTSQRPRQHSARPTQACQGHRQGFQAPRPASRSGPQRLTKKIASRHSLRKLPSGVLMKHGKVTSYSSRQLKLYEEKYLTHDLELAVVIFALKIWRQYLYKEACDIFTNHKSLKCPQYEELWEIMADLKCLEVEIYIRKAGGFIAQMRVESTLLTRIKEAQKYNGYVFPMIPRFEKHYYRRYIVLPFLFILVKIEHQQASGLLQLQQLEIPVWKWENITVDLVTGLAGTLRKNDAIWVVVDRLTKLAHFLAIREGYSSSKFVEIFQKEIVRLHGTHVSNVLYRDLRFTS
nr:hypothetical protein [Tanacetum cinerariifolium]